MAVTLSAMFPEHTSYIRDISQAYVQSESRLERQIFLRPPSEMSLPSGKVLLVLKPLYGIPESGLHWFITYSSHHIEQLGMQVTRYDPCVLYRKEKYKIYGITVLQVDDSFGNGCEEFLDTEEHASKRFQCKPRKLLKRGPMPFQWSQYISTGWKQLLHGPKRETEESENSLKCAGFFQRPSTSTVYLLLHPTRYLRFCSAVSECSSMPEQNCFQNNESYCRKMSFYS